MQERYKEDVLIVCRETNFNTGECIVYDVGYVDENDLCIPHLQLRSRYNAELEYYAILKSQLELKDYIVSLIKKKVPSILYTYV